MRQGRRKLQKNRPHEAPCTERQTVTTCCVERSEGMRGVRTRGSLILRSSRRKRGDERIQGHLGALEAAEVKP